MQQFATLLQTFSLLLTASVALSYLFSYHYIHEGVWPAACTHIAVQMILTSLSNLPETMGLFLVGLVLIISGIVLRRVFLTLETAVPASGQHVESKEHPVK